MRSVTAWSFAVVVAWTMALSSVAAAAADAATVSFYESCEPTDYTVRGDLDCRVGKQAQAQLRLDSALRMARAAIVARSQELEIRASEVLAEAKGDAETVVQARERAKMDLKAAKKAIEEFDLEQQQWTAYSNTACSYLRHRELYGANGPAVISLACETNIISDRTNQLLALLEVASNHE